MLHTSPITSDADIIDSRDIIARIEYLADFDDEEGNAERVALEALVEQGEDLADWQYGETLIRDSYFAEHAEELADDIGAIDKNASWPLTHIDWEAAAEELKQDYTSIEFDGVTYWAR